MPLHFRLAAFATLGVLASGAIAQQAGNTADAQQPRKRAQVVHDLNRPFARIDNNRDGTLSKAEMDAAEAIAMQRRAAASQAWMNAEFTRLNTNPDGQLSRAEFMAWVPQPRVVPTDPAIRRLDVNKDAKISLQEFSAPTLDIFERFDTNKGGVLNAQERQAAAASQAAQRRRR